MTTRKENVELAKTSLPEECKIGKLAWCIDKSNVDLLNHEEPIIVYGHLYVEIPLIYEHLIHVHGNLHLDKRLVGTTLVVEGNVLANEQTIELTHDFVCFGTVWADIILIGRSLSSQIVRADRVKILRDLIITESIQSRELTVGGRILAKNVLCQEVITAPQDVGGLIEDILKTE